MPTALPDLAAVMAHSTTPLRSAPTVSAKGITTGTAPRLPSSSDWPTEEARTRRPARSDRPEKGRRQNTT